MTGLPALSKAQISSLRRIAEADGPVGWIPLWRLGKFGHRWTIGSLAERGLIEERHALWDGADYEFWELSDAGRDAIAATLSQET